MPRVANHNRRALTLLEVIIAIALIGMLMGMMVTFFWQVVEVRDTTAEAADRMQVARQVLARIEAELRSCIGASKIGFPIEQPLVEDEFLEDIEDVERTVEEVAVEGDEGLGGELSGELADLFSGTPAADPNAPLTGNVPLLVGDRRNITFLTARLPAEHQYEFIGVDEIPPPAQHDLTQVSYWLWVDPEDTDEDGEPIIGGIMRTEKKTLNQFLVEFDDPLDVRNDLWSPELGYLEFRYFDGVEWDTVWDVTKGNSLPQLIQVTVGFEPCSNDELENRDLDEYPLIDYPYGDDRVHRDRYSIIVRIPAADKFFSSRVNKQLGQGLPEQLGFEEGF